MRSAGRASNHGVIPISWPFGTVGPMCKTVQAAALVLAAIAGYDERDPTSRNVSVGDYAAALRMRTSKMRIGIPRAPFYENLVPEVSRAVEAALAVLREIAGEVKEVQLPASPGLGAVSNAEIYAYHAPWVTKTPELYQEATRRIVLGGAKSTADTYIHGLRRVDLARRDIVKAFSAADVVVMPTTTGVTSLIPRPGSAPPAAGAVPAA